MEKAQPLLSVRDLRIAFGNKKDKKEIVHGITFDLYSNKILGIVGESGSGKSITSLAIMKLLPKKNVSISGEILFEDKNLLSLGEKQIRNIRGKEISMIFQEPMSALNPSMKCGKQVAEVIQLHTKKSYAQAKTACLELFKKVKLPRPEELYNSYPHQLSGGQMQRIMIAMAIACKPKLLIADEPTTALDVTVQKEILQLLKDIQQETGMAMIFISHDLNLVSQVADDILVLYQGKMIEKATSKTIFSNPKEEYTKALIAARPSLHIRLEKLPTIASYKNNDFIPKEITPTDRARRHKEIYLQPPLLEVRDLKKHYFSNIGFFSKTQTVRAVNNVSFSVYEGETLGLVGESGCGKSTLGKTIMQLETATSGSIRYRGAEITNLSKEAIQKLRKEIQIIFQDPYASLNPRLTIGTAIMEPMEVHGLIKNRQEAKNKTIELLNKVGLDAGFFKRYPHELSGGQRQRVGIARTIAVQPKLIICDESVSALDISVQAQVLNLLNALKKDFGFTYIFISHDLAVVKYMSDQLMVMNNGKIEELGDADEIYASPQSVYTKKLIDAIPKGIN
ncbi:MAG: ABC transporter ATP-binding protein [Bacteroidetes bacterium]|jgi:peptide/nickel transport system ATP-binding protein|nr:ABC transporter ATP-binding protein [Bacteroidota bacterium]